MRKYIKLDIRSDGIPVVRISDVIELTSIPAAAFKAVATMECITALGMTLAGTTTATILILMVVTETGVTAAVCDLSQPCGDR